MKDQVVVVTGASAGIGAAVAREIARRGARPVLVARRERELSAVAAACGEGAFAIVADVTRRADMERVVATTIERAGRIDTWVNNAGRGISREPSRLTDEDIDAMLLVNFKAMLYGVQAVLPHFVARGRGHVVNVSTNLSRAPLAPMRSAYCAAKAAMDSLSATLRVELRGTHPGIAISVVHPGIVATDFGLNALHGGVDSRALPGAQDVAEVAAVIAGVIEEPRADTYTRAGAREMIAGYYAADDMGAAEARPPFVRPRA
jgi:NADP-dependent 3-hydroxy acid dehydrogenase YdfG